jgi:RNA polymerase sigma factor (sigma-70 family)
LTLALSSKVKTGAPQIDSLLLPFLLTTDEREEAIILADLISEHVEPIVKRILRYKLQFYHGRADAKIRNPDAEEVFNEIQLHLLKRLRDLKKGSSNGSVGNLHSYVATAARHTCDEYLRHKYPRRRQLKDKIRYHLTTHAEFALWENGEHNWLSGLAAWNHQAEAYVSSRNAHWTPELQAFVETKLQDSDVRQQKLDNLMHAVFRAWGEPLEIDCLTALIAKLLDVEDRPEESLEDDGDGHLSQHLVAAQTPPDRVAEYHQRLEQLWKEIRQLPRRQRVALLLNLRNPQRINVITLFPATNIATFEQLAEILEIPLEEFENLWANLPMNDSSIAELLGATRQQVINLRKNARDRLMRRMKALEEKHS